MTARPTDSAAGRIAPGQRQTKDTALARRIKQHVIGREQRFFAVTPPGLESLCHRELTGLSVPPTETTQHKGGVAFAGRLTTCYQANLMCRTVSRVLMRIQRFKARDFESLEKRTQSIPWELYLNPRAPLQVTASAHASRLYHSDAVVERIVRAINDRLAVSQPTDSTIEDPSGPTQRIWARLENDRLTLSLDSSGDHLHKRGVKIHFFDMT